MFVMVIKHTVRNYESWKSVYDTFPPTAGGAVFAQVHRSTDAPNDVLVVAGWSAVLRRLQTGSVRAYAMSLFVGVVVIVGYYLSAWVR